MNETELIGIVGAGTMGSGIAQVAAQAGYTVLLYALKQAFVGRGLHNNPRRWPGRVGPGARGDREVATV